MSHKGANPKASTAREEGAVLLLVLLILTLISVLVLSWAQEWRTELKLASNFGEAHKAHRLAEAGIYYALGKLVIAKAAEADRLKTVGSQSQEVPRELWQGDQRPHVLELPDGKAEIRIGDESGKINLNFAPEEVLKKFFAGLGLAEPQIRTMVDSIQDWRTKESSPRPNGAKSAYYLNLDPPYVAKNGNFETVEELAWVRGFEGSPLIPRLSQWLTVQAGDRSVNVNTAPLEVLLAMGFSQAAAQNIIATRQSDPFPKFAGGSPTRGEPVIGPGPENLFPVLAFFYDYLHRYGKKKCRTSNDQGYSACRPKPAGSLDDFILV